MPILTIQGLVIQGLVMQGLVMQDLVTHGWLGGIAVVVSTIKKLFEAATACLKTDLLIKFHVNFTIKSSCPKLSFF